MFLLAEVATEIFQENPTVFLQAREKRCIFQSQYYSSEVAVTVQLTATSKPVMLQDVKRGRYHKLQSSDPSLLAVATDLGVQPESGARTAGVSVLRAETVRSLMADKRKV